MRSNPSRWLGPLALGAAVLAVLFVITTSMGDEEKDAVAPAGTTEERRESRTSTGTGTGTTSTTSTDSERRTYRVRPGDTLQVIAERTGVSIEEIQELNPDIDPQSLTVGQRIKLTE